MTTDRLAPDLRLGAPHEKVHAVEQGNDSAHPEQRDRQPGQPALASGQTAARPLVVADLVVNPGADQQLAQRRHFGLRHGGPGNAPADLPVGPPRPFPVGVLLRGIGLLSASHHGAAITGPAITGPAITGPAITGPAITGPAITGRRPSPAPVAARKTPQRMRSAR